MADKSKTKSNGGSNGGGKRRCDPGSGSTTPTTLA